MNKDLLNRLLDYYHLTFEDYGKLIAPVSEENFALGHKFDHMKEAVTLVNEVMAHEGKIFIYGDYDADGIMGTSILVKMFSYKNYPVNYYIPSRYLDGYGLTLKKSKWAVENNIELVICVDNGISAFEPIEYLKQNGVKVLVLDHHQEQDRLPVADYILHPIVSHFGETASCGGFVAFMFSQAFLGRFDKYLSTLAAISVISDMMPLKDYNRNFLRLVFKNYKNHEFKQIDALKEGEEFNEVAIGMKIAPKINAIGRLIEDESINNLVEFFTRDDDEKFLNYITWINNTNEERKNASKEASDSLTDIDESSKAIVYVTNAKEGLLGLIANQIASKYQKPTIVFSSDISGEFYKGSSRAPIGFNVADSFIALSEYLEAYGGHAGAGGCTIRKDRFEEFKKAYLKYAEETPLQVVEKPFVKLGITELNFDNYELISTFSPFGEEWPRPYFKMGPINTKSLLYSKDGNHILTSLGLNSRLTGFNLPRSLFTELPFIDVYGTLRLSTFRNFTNVEFLINEYKPAK